VNVRHDLNGPAREIAAARALDHDRADLIPLRGTTAREIAASLEAAVRQGALVPGASLPSVRQLATRLGVSPPTVAAALADLRRRGVIVTHERRRSSISPRPPVVLPTPLEPSVPPDVFDLARGNPDPELLPDLRPALARLAAAPMSRLYGDEPVDPHLFDLARRELAEAGVQPDQITLVSGALDGVERALAAHLAQGDRVVVEDPGYFAVFDLLRAMGLEPVPVPIDSRGLLPEALAETLRNSRAQAIVLTPRAHNPTGAALDAERAAALRAVLESAPGLLLVEDDHQGPIAGAPGHTLTRGRQHWAVVRSVAKSLGPDLRMALVGGDAETIARIEGRMALGPGWVSHLLQQVVADVLGSSDVRQHLARAEATYVLRRVALLDALHQHGIAATGRSGFNVWVPVSDETAVASRLLQAGWAVAPGARYRLASQPAIRVTCASLPETVAPRFAADLAQACLPTRRSRLA
jgi:DNA-binding transcriptional MocR family regulator